MSTRLSALAKGVVAFAGAAALTAAALLGGAAAATAATNGNVDLNATGSIIVHKHAQPATTGTAGTGEDLGVLANPLEGVEFTVQKVDLDLSVPANWDTIMTLDPATAPLTGTATTLATDADGIATFGGLPVGVYLVTEGTAPASLGIVSKAAPFFVVIPTSINGTWTYNVHAYPKNSVSSLEKTLDETVDAGVYGQGDIVTWNVKSTAPTLKTGDTFTAYRITDTLDPRLAYESVANVKYDGTALDAADYTVTHANGVVTVELTSTGLAKVLANSGKLLTFDLNTKVVGDVGTGVIPNHASQFTNVNNQQTTVDSTPDNTYWGYVNVLKTDKDNQSVLAGAEFQVFPTEADALAGTNAITVNGSSTFTTAADGTLKIGALNVGAAGTTRDYWIKETKAPAGYVLPQDATAIQKVTVAPGANADVTYTVDNMKQDRPDLPLTGATGTALFVLGGISLVAVAIGVATRNQRRARA